MSFNLSVMKFESSSSLLLSGSFISSADSAAYFQLRQPVDQLVLRDVQITGTVKTYDPISHSYLFLMAFPSRQRICVCRTGSISLQVCDPAAIRSH